MRITSGEAGRGREGRGLLFLSRCLRNFVKDWGRSNLTRPGGSGPLLLEIWERRSTGAGQGPSAEGSLSASGGQVKGASVGTMLPQERVARAVGPQGSQPASPAPVSVWAQLLRRPLASAPSGWWALLLLTQAWK